MGLIDFKVAITKDLAEIDLALSVLNGLSDVNLARLALLQEAEKRSARNRAPIARRPERWPPIFILR